MSLLLARAYAFLVWFMAKKLRIWLPGLGFLCRRIGREHVIRAFDRQYLFDPDAASMYGALLVGRSMEPETHLLFRRILPRLPRPAVFVDVGAAIGEMVIDAAGYETVEQVIAFDPDPDNARACRRSAALNGYTHVTVIEKVVTDHFGPVHFRMQRQKGTSGTITQAADRDTEQLVATTLDHEIPASELLHLVLIDVEGFEPQVLAGGREFVRKTRPLIIFEYIDGRDHGMPAIREVLGAEWEVYRLRSDGFLDTTMHDTWNCLAVHRESVFHGLCGPLVR